MRSSLSCNLKKVNLPVDLSFIKEDQKMLIYLYE